jgi:hypothetical protein
MATVFAGTSTAWQLDWYVRGDDVYRKENLAVVS